MLRSIWASEAVAGLDAPVFGGAGAGGAAAQDPDIVNNRSMAISLFMTLA